MQNDFLNGPTAIATELDDYAYTLCTHTLDFLTNQEEALSDDEILRIMYGYASMFSHPEIIFADTTEPDTDNKTPSAQNIMLKNIDLQLTLRKDTADNSQLQKQYNILASIKNSLLEFERLKKEDALKLNAELSKNSV